MALRTWGIRASLCAVVVLCMVCDAAARGSARRKVTGYRNVELAGLRANPSAYVGTRVSFDCYFAELGDIYQPFQTPFVAEQYVNFHVWDPDAKLWDNRARKDAYLFCYVARELENQVSYIMSRKMYDSVRLFGRVAVVFGGEPWFDLEDVETSAIAGYKENALKHILVGIRALQSGRFEMAKDRFEDAQESELPMSAQRYVSRELGRAYYELGDYGQAAMELAEAASIAEGPDAWVSLRRGQALSRRVDQEIGRKRKKTLREAFMQLEAAREIEPRNAITLAEIGLVKAKEGKRDQGIKMCREALDVVPIPREAHGEEKHQTESMRAEICHTLGSIYLMMDRVQDARASFEQAIQYDFTVKRYHRVLAELFMRQEDYRNAQNYCDNVVGLDPADASAFLMRAEVRLKRGDANGAIEDYVTAHSLDPENLDALIGKARVHVSRHELDEAENTLRRAEQLNSDSVKVLVAHAEVLVAQQKYEEAVKECKNILRRSKELGEQVNDVYLTMARALSGQEKPNLGGAAGYLTKVVKAEPGHLDARRLLAQIYMQMSRFANAVQVLEEIKKLAPGDVASRRALALAMAENSDWKGAVAELRALLVEHPDLAGAKNDLAYYLAEFGGAGALEEALALAQDVSQSDPANPVYLDTLGWILCLSGKHDLARAKLSIAVIKATLPDPFVHLALVADKLGQKDIARRNLDLGLKRLGEVTARGFLWRNLNGKAQNLNMTLK